MNLTNLRRIAERFETTGTLGVQPGRGRKGIKQEQVEGLLEKHCVSRTCSRDHSRLTGAIKNSSEIYFSCRAHFQGVGVLKQGQTAVERRIFSKRANGAARPCKPRLE
ncbi:unnamed protein product [Larinioides sclopetarius]|uniref:Ribosomal protein S13 n=1 Tax=Larinioides sclopetarius TaxID=280406 RepID=A0AAV2A1U4_9ARAC